MWSYTSTPPHVFMVWYLVKHRHNFTFYLYAYIQQMNIISIPEYWNWVTWVCFRAFAQSSQLTSWRNCSNSYRSRLQPLRTPLTKQGTRKAVAAWSLLHKHHNTWSPHILYNEKLLSLITKLIKRRDIRERWKESKEERNIINGAWVYSQ